MKKFTKLSPLMMVVLLALSTAIGQKQTILNGDNKTEYPTPENELDQSIESQQNVETLANIWKNAGKDTGNDPLNIKSTYPPNFNMKGGLDCPQGSQFSQSAVGYVYGVNSDFAEGYKLFQYFSGLTDDVSFITFWGINAFFDVAGWNPCSEDPRDYEITFYGDNAGEPDTLNVLHTVSVTLAGIPTGVLFSGIYEIQRYQYAFAPALTGFTDGWVSVQGYPGTPVNDCWFIWIDSGTAGTVSYQLDHAAGTWAPTAYTQSLCLGGDLPADDIGVTAIVQPNSGPSLGMETVEIQITNFGSNDQTGFDVYYILDGGVPVVENYAGTVGSGAVVNYTYTTLADVSGVGDHTLEACTDLTGDLNPANDCFQKIVTTFDPFDCNWYIIGDDSYGDGWDGGSIDIYSNNLLIHSWVGPTTTGPEQFSFGIYEGETLDFVWNNGSYDDEVSYTVYNYFDEVIFSQGPFPVTINGINGTCIPNPCPEPLGLISTSIGLTTADMEWSEAGTATTWSLCWGEPAFDPDVNPIGTEIINDPTGGNPHSFQITGLSHSTSYDSYVQSDCGDINSSWIGPNSFSTICMPFVAPYLESFSDWPPSCVDLSGGSESFIQYTPTPCAMANFWGWPTSDDAFMTLEVDISGFTEPGFQFNWSHAYHPSYPDDQLIVTVSDGITTTEFFNLTGPAFESADGATSIAPGSFVPSGYFDLSTFISPITIEFHAISGFGPDLFIDDVLVVDNPACPPPYGVKVIDIELTQAEVEWTSFAGPSNLQYGLESFTPDVDPIGNHPGVSSPQSLTGLVESTVYDVYIQDDCGPDGISMWVGPVSFRTQSPSGELLYQIDLEDIVGNGDIQFLGAEFLGGYLWVTSRSDVLGSPSIYKIDHVNKVLVNTYPQGTVSLWGMRDLCNDGTYLYAGDDNGFYQIDPGSGVVTTLFTTTNMGVIRALAYNDDNGHFWTKDFGGDIYEFDAAGTIYNQFPNSASAFGAAWDPNTDMLWFHATGQYSPENNEFIEIDPVTGLTTGTAIGIPDSPCKVSPIVGGGFMDFGNMYPGRIILGGLLQGTPDVVHIVEYQDTGFPEQTKMYMPYCGANGIPLNGTISWEFGANTDTYEVYFGPAGVYPLPMVYSGTTGGATTGSWTYPTLAGSSQFEWEVWGFNTSNQAPTKSVLLNFATVCEAFVITPTTPYMISFDLQSDPDCWTNTSSDPFGSGLWEYGNAMMNTPGYNLAGTPDHTGTGGFYAWADGSTPVVPDMTLLSPFFDVSTLTNPSVEFYLLSNNGANPGDNCTFKLDFFDGANWNQGIVSYSGDDSNWLLFDIPLSGYNITGNIQFRFIVDQSTAVTAYYNDILLDDVRVGEATSCPDPFGMSVENLTYNAADLVWINFSGLSNIEWGPAGFFPGTGIIYSVASPYTISGLLQNTDYEFYVQANCVNSVSNWVGPFAFTTDECNIIAPHSEFYTDWPPVCWDLVSGTLDWTQYNINTFASARFGSWGNPNGWAEMILDVDISDLTNPTLRFDWSHLYLTAYSDDAFQIRVSSDGGNVWTLIWNYTGAIYNSNDGAGYTSPGTFTSSGFLDLSLYGSPLQIKFTASSPGGGPDLFIDNLFIEEMQTCLYPRDMRTLNITMTSADLWWTDYAGASEWEIENGLAGFIPTDVPTHSNITSIPFNITGLAPQTTYDFYVRAVCGPDDISFWNGPFTYTTNCAPVNAPINESFYYWPPDCWYYTSTLNNFIHYYAPPISCAKADFKNHPSGVREMKIALDVSEMASPAVWFDWSHLYKNLYDSFSLEISEDDYSWNSLWLRMGAAFNSNDGATATTPGTFVTTEKIDLSNFSDLIYLRFRATSELTGGNDLFIDNFTIDEMCPNPSNPEATNFTATTADLFWIDNAEATVWDIENGLAGFTPTGVPTHEGVTSNPYTITGLTPQTLYEYYIRANCGSGFSSIWVGPYTYQTCDAAPIPFTETFLISDFPSCWAQEFTAGSDRWNVSNTSYAGGTPNEMVALWIYGSGVSRLISPAIDLSGVTSAILEFDHYYVDFTTGITAKIQSSADGINWVDEAFSITSGSGDVGPELVTIPITTLSPTTYIAFVLDGNHTAFDYWYVDNVCIESKCYWEIWLYDNFGDGWNGALMDVLVDGVVVLDDITIPNGFGPEVFSFPITEGNTVVTDFHAPGGWPQECRYEIYNNSSQLVAADGPNPVGLTLLSVSCQPICPFPQNLNTQNITANTADLFWDEMGLATTWDLCWGFPGFDPDNPSTHEGSFTKTETGGSSPYSHSISNLVQSSNYEWYIRAVCAAGDFSNWAGPEAFTTSCGILTPPFSEDFPTGLFPDCWTQTFEGGITSDRWIISNTSLAGGSPWEMKALDVYAVGISRLILPSLDLSTGMNPTLEFKHFYDDYGAGITIKIQSSTDGGSTWTDETGWPGIISGGGNIGPETVSCPLTANSANTLIAFVLDGDHYQFDIWNIDDVAIAEGSAFSLDLTVLLEGPYNGTNMNTGCNARGLLPLNQPFNSPPWNYPGTETVTSIPNADVVDWILVELRDAADATSALPGTIIGQQAAFLRNDGSIVSLDGISHLSFNHTFIHSLFVVIWHRNHLGVMSADPVTGSGGIYSYNFTLDASTVYGGSAGHKELIYGSNIWGMIAGDGDANNEVNMLDKSNVWILQAGKQGYLNGDFNLDGQVDNPDKNEKLIENIGADSQVPN